MQTGEYLVRSVMQDAGQIMTRQEETQEAILGQEAALKPYLHALRLARAELLAQEIQGKRTASAVDLAVDNLLDGYYAND